MVAATMVVVLVMLVVLVLVAVTVKYFGRGDDDGVGDAGGGDCDGDGGVLCVDDDVALGFEWIGVDHVAEGCYLGRQWIGSFQNGIGRDIDHLRVMPLIRLLHHPTSTPSTFNTSPPSHTAT